MKKNQKVLYLIIALVILIVTILLIINSTNKNEKELESTSNNLWTDYQTKKITVDEYVKNMLYLDYDIDLLDDKYKSSSKLNNIEIDNFIIKNLDKLSDTTKEYYLRKINLENVTFELDEENNESKSNISSIDFFVENVYAKEENVTNLNKVVMSDNKNFIVWYTTTGNSKTDYESAKKIANGLEKTITKYKNYLGYNYVFESRIVSKGKKYEDQVKVLKQNNIDASYLEKSMQVYLVNYTDSSLAKYTSKKITSTLSDLAQKVYGSDIMGSIAFPYVLIKPNSFDDYETLEQLYNHEMFHHYQFEILCGNTNCDSINDDLMFEASANWGSSLITEKTNNEGFLNNWAATARNASDKLLSDETLNNYGKETIGYALYVYLNNYSSYAKNGTKNIITSIYKDNSLNYLYNNTSNNDLIKIQENIALKNITQDYYNKNLNASPSSENKLPIVDVITDDSNNNNYNRIISPIGIEYYRVNTNNNYEIKLKKQNIDISLFIIKKEYGRYYIVDSNKESCEKECTFNTNNYKNYDELYIAIANTDLTSSNEYSLTIKKSSEVIGDTNDDDELFNTTNNNFVSIKNCQIYIHDYDEIYGAVYTFYYDDNKIVNKLIGSIFLRENADFDSWYKYTKRDYGTVRFKNNNVLQFVYPQKYFDKLYSGRNIDDIIGDYRDHCADCMPDEDCPETYILDYNPNA